MSSSSSKSSSSSVEGMSISSTGSDTISTNGSSVHQGVPLAEKCMFLVKGADIDDDSVEYRMSMNKQLRVVYDDYAKRFGVHLADLSLVYHEKLLQHDGSLNTYKFNTSGDVVLAYKKVKQIIIFNVGFT